MIHAVPDWDDNSHSLKVYGDSNLYHIGHIGKEGVHQHLHQHHLHQNHYSSQTKSSVALVPNHDGSVSLMQVGMQGDAGTHIPGELERASVTALDVPPVMSNPCAHEDEMLSWLRYPLEDSYDRNYCSEIFGELVNPRVQLVKDAYVHQTMQESENVHVLQIEGMGCEQVGLQQLTNTASMHCARAGFKSDAALAMGAGRAAGVLSQTGSEVFHGVRTHVYPSSLLKPWSSSAAEPLPEQAVGGQTTSQVQWQDGRAAGKKVFENGTDPMMRLLDMRKTSVLSPTTPSMSSGFNFSVFCRPVATTLDSLRFVGAASGPTNVERARQPLAKGTPPPCEPSMGDSNCSSVVMSMLSPQQSTEFSSQVKVARDGSGYALSDWCLPTSLPCRPDGRLHKEKSEFNTCFSGSAITVSENAVGTIEIAETTVSPSRLSGSSTEKIAEEGFTTTPKKTSFLAEFSEDAEDVTAPNAKKPPPGPRAMKRTRAAETHNESEKKRRNKINVRLKALQSLIPNSNKTDKASVLDEAIEYTKMLQAQVQFMSMRTGIYVPMPSAMQYVPVQQMPTLSHMGMGMGMGLGMGVDMSVGMRVTDINEATAGIGGAGAGAGAGAALNLSPTSNQSPSRQALGGARLPQPSSAPLICDVSGCLPTSAREPYKVMLAQQPLQPMLMNAQVNADMYSALLQQRQPQENHISNASR